MRHECNSTSIWYRNAYWNCFVFYSRSTWDDRQIPMVVGKKIRPLSNKATKQSVLHSDASKFSYLIVIPQIENQHRK